MDIHLIIAGVHYLVHHIHSIFVRYGTLFWVFGLCLIIAVIIYTFLFILGLKPPDHPLPEADISSAQYSSETQLAESASYIFISRARTYEPDSCLWSLKQNVSGTCCFRFPVTFSGWSAALLINNSEVYIYACCLLTQGIIWNCS